MVKYVEQFVQKLGAGDKRFFAYFGMDNENGKNTVLAFYSLF